MKANFEKMDVPFIVAHIIRNAMSQAKPAYNGELKVIVSGERNGDYMPIYINAAEEDEINKFLKEIFG